MAKLLTYLSKLITGNVISAKTVMDSMLKHRTMVADRTTAKLLPFWTAETPFPDIAALILAIASYLKHATDAMSGDDRGHTRTVTTRKGHVETRDRVLDEVLAELTKMRTAMQGVFKEADIAALGVFRPLGEQPMEVLRQCELVVESLDAENALTSIIPGIDGPTNAAAITAGFREKVTELSGLLDVLGVDHRDFEATLLKKRRSTKVYEHVFLHGARLWESLLRLTGFPEEAARVRPSTQRPGRTDTEPDDDGDGDEPELPEIPEARVSEPAAPEATAAEVTAAEPKP